MNFENQKTKHTNKPRKTIPRFQNFGKIKKIQFLKKKEKRGKFAIWKM